MSHRLSFFTWPTARAVFLFGCGCCVLVVFVTGPSVSFGDSEVCSLGCLFAKLHSASVFSELSAPNTPNPAGTYVCGCI